MPLWLQVLLIPIGAYLLGSIPFGLVLTAVFAGTDVRRHGSGNIGATNVRRVAGNRIAAATLVADMAKGLIPALLAVVLIDPATLQGAFYAGLVAICALAGHLFPLFLRFRTGGKGVATAIGAFLGLAPAAMVIALLVFVLAVCAADRVSVGSLTSFTVLPVFVHLTGKPPLLTAWALAAAAAVIWAHRANLVRLWRGKEPRTGLRW
jgi:glycerol-3-phosphate acyltransferase PlsY